MSQGDESVVAEIPVFSKHKWLKTGLKSSGSNRRRLKGTILLWFIVLRRVVMCSTLAKDFSWALSLAAGTMHCRKSLLSVSSFNGMTWLLLLLTEKEVMAHEQTMCHSYSVREDEQGGQEPWWSRNGLKVTQGAIPLYLSKKSKCICLQYPGSSRDIWTHPQRQGQEIKPGSQGLNWGPVQVRDNAHRGMAMTIGAKEGVEFKCSSCWGGQDLACQSIFSHNSVYTCVWFKGAWLHHWAWPRAWAVKPLSAWGPDIENCNGKVT